VEEEKKNERLAAQESNLYQIKAWLTREGNDAVSFKFVHTNEWDGFKRSSTITYYVHSAAGGTNV
jgi:hypothetical protein